MDSELSIQQAAGVTGLSAHTLRYYERVGLLDRVGRAQSGHRRHVAADLAWLDLLMRLRATGMPIRQMQEFAALRRRGPETARERRRLLVAHRQTVRARIQALEENMARLDEKIARLDERLAGMRVVKPATIPQHSGLPRMLSGRNSRKCASTRTLARCACRGCSASSPSGAS
jgi:DNA-binding transcriptional MerR regulator